MTFPRPFGIRFPNVGPRRLGFSGITAPGPIFSDNFSRPDGPIGGGWTGATWTIASNKAVNTPTLGSEVLVDGGFENWNSPTDLTSWSEVLAAGCTINQEATIKNSGSFSCRVDIDASNGNARPSQAISGQGAYTWLSTSIYARSSTTGKSVRVDVSGDGLSPAVIANLTTDFQIFFHTWRAFSSGAATLFPTRQSAASSSIYWDDASIKPMTLSTLFTVRDTGRTGQNVSGTYSVLVDGTMVGVLANVKSDLSAGIVAWIDGANIRLEKWIGTTWTSLISTTQAPTGSLLPQIKTVRSGSDLLVDLIYNGLPIGTQQTVSDAEIIDNTYTGLFSTHAGNSFSSFSVSENP